MRDLSAPILYYNDDMLHCPNRDGLLKKYSVAGKNNLPLTYYRCPYCRGFWLTGFSANFIKDIHEAPTARATDAPTFHPKCPECDTPLTHARGDAIAPGVSVWRCEAGHGYFFPSGELTKFKETQSAKLTYHKLWNIPLPSVASVLLASLAILLVSTAAIVATIRQRQVIQSQAQSIFQRQRALVTEQGMAVFIASTTLPASVTLFVETNNYMAAMETKDGTTHTATVSKLTPATYIYYFLIERNGQRSVTRRFTLVVP